MSKNNNLKQYVIDQFNRRDLQTKEGRSKFYKDTAKKFKVSWETVVGVFMSVKRSEQGAREYVEDMKVELQHTKKRLDKRVVVNAEIEELDTPAPYKGGNPNNVLVIGDTHEPFCKDGYLEFCREVQEKYNCGTVVHIGDLVDNHAMSYHEHDPEGRSIGDEYRLALSRTKRWYRTFPNVKICIGNHDALPFRKAFTAGLPSTWLKSYQEILQSPKTWEWDFIHEVNGVLYQHGTGMSGEMAAINAARENRQSTVIGHLHTVCNTRFLASFKDLIFGVSVGCGINHKTYAFAYGRENTRKPVVSCAVILDGKTPINIPMNFKK
jgi:predicted phosphodiesterase